MSGKPGKSIEAGHFYLHESLEKDQLGFSEEQQVGIDLALNIIAQSEQPIEFLLFIDDLHNNPHLITNWEEIEIYEALKYHPEIELLVFQLQAAGVPFQIISEMAMTTSAIHLYSLLDKKGVLSKGKQTLRHDLGSTLLLTKEGQPTCALIDAALYLKKVGPDASKPTITLLPIRYKKEQHQVKTILKAFGYEQLPVTVMYHDDEGTILEQEEWLDSSITEEHHVA